MTSTLTFVAPGATIRAADAPRRTIEGRVITYGEYGNTSAGRKRFRPGSIELPADPREVLLLRGHTGPDGRPQGEDGVQAGAAVRLDDDAERLDASFRVTALPVGDVLLAEADPECPIRGGLSVEVFDVQLDPADSTTVVRCKLKAVAAVPFQAYPSSRMTTVAASAHNPGEPSVTEAPPAPAPAAPALDLHALAAELAPMLQAASAPGGLPFAGVPAAAPAAPAADPVQAFCELQAALYTGNTGRAGELRAALADITYTSVDLFQQPAGTIGEKLWEGAGYQRQFVGLMRSKPLTSYKYRSWQWVNRPKVAAYAGDKAPIPTNTVSVEEFEHVATRIAGGWDIDRALRDFPNPEFWAEFLAAGVESYREVSDLQAAAALVAFARDITVDGNVPASYTTINTAQDASAVGLIKAVALGTAIMEDTPRVRRAPDYVLVNTVDWLRLIDLGTLDLPAFLATMTGIAPGQFRRTDQVAPGSVVMGVREAMTFRELGGDSPIRVEALDVAKGGIDEALFGYTGISGDRPGGVIEVPLAASGG